MALDLDDATYSCYAGFYQGLAWAQGTGRQGPLSCSIPNELMYSNAAEPITFHLRAFMEVVADLDDEGSIHLWEVGLAEEEMTLWCTEDLVPRDTEIPDTARHSSWWATYLRETT